MYNITYNILDIGINFVVLQANKKNISIMYLKIIVLSLTTTYS